MIVALLMDGIEVKEWWWPDVQPGFSKQHYDNLERHIRAATAHCESDVLKMVNPARCTWCVKIKSRGKTSKRLPGIDGGIEKDNGNEYV
jgi:hypothetical protein